jgi:hypothetical protein
MKAADADLAVGRRDMIWPDGAGRGGKGVGALRQGRARRLKDQAPVVP